jgi:DNA polymerase III alpha subunit (gram-positive type)
MRFLALDFETNGRSSDDVLPCGGFPTQVSVTACVPATGDVLHLYNSYIRGAKSLSDWVCKNTSVTLELLENAPLADEVSLALGNLWNEGDVIVAHNACFDLGVVLPKIAPANHPFLACPWVCTMQEGWAMCALRKRPTLGELCGLLEVPYVPSMAHDATYDTHALASCLLAAHARGRKWSVCAPEDL